MFTFLHTADWQIGRQYHRFDSEDSVGLFEARFRTVEKIATLATEKQVDAVVVAGDVFDAQGVSIRTIRRLFNALQGYSGPWLLLPGNHDAALVESVWSVAQRLNVVTDNVTLLLEPAPVLLGEEKAIILPAPLTQRNTYEDLTEWFDGVESGPGVARIGVAHGSVEGILAEDIDSPNPVSSQRASSARLDYLALGDWHGLKQVNDRTWYSGTPEQERFRDNNAGHVLEVCVTPGGGPLTVTPIEVTEFRWHSVNVGIAVPSDIDQLASTLEQYEKPAVIDITLSGRVDLADYQRLLNLLSVHEARHRVLQWNLDELRLHPTPEDIQTLEVDGFVGEVMTELMAGQDEDQAVCYRDALTVLAGMLLDDSRVGGESSQ